MGTDWSFAWQLGGVGFGVVFTVLIILAVAIWLAGLVIRKFVADEEKPSGDKKGV